MILKNNNTRNNLIQIANKRYNPKREQLKLYHCECWQDILSLGDWSMIKVLDLDNCAISDSNIHVLFQYSWPHLTVLDLFQNNIKAEGIKLFSLKKWPQLEALNLNNNNIDGEDLVLLMGGTLPKLKNLFISECKIKLDKMLKTPTIMTKLKKLQISKNNFGNGSIKWLVKFNMPYLQTLYIYQCQIGGQGSKELSKAYWPRLNQLWMNRNETQNENYLDLSAWGSVNLCNWKNLTALYVKEKQAINWLGSVCVQIESIKIHSLLIKITNFQLLKQVKQILVSRNLLI